MGFNKIRPDSDRPRYYDEMPIYAAVLKSAPAAKMRFVIIVSYIQCPAEKAKSYPAVLKLDICAHAQSKYNRRRKRRQQEFSTSDKSFRAQAIMINKPVRVI